MKKKVLLLVLSAVFTFSAIADEGMWIPMLIGKNIPEMQRMGFKLTAEDLYSVNHSSLKDAIVQFGRGCTGELISDQGLLITNHHCGFSSIQSHSTVDNNLLANGFWAKSHADELPNPGLTVRFLVRMDDVTDKVLKNVTTTMTELERAKAIGQVADSLIELAEKEGVGYEAIIRPFYYGNQYFIFVYQVFEDVRLVGAPPETIGKFGGDTDNWVWPRHTGDFSMFRIYADKNNNPAPYSPDNVPYKPKRFLKISTKGIKEGDFTLVYGFPGRTKQYITSHEVNLIINQINPNNIALRDIRLSIFDSFMSKNDTIAIKYASKHARVANAWKKWIGETMGLKRLNAVSKKQELESMFAAWASSKPELNERYGWLLPKFEQLYSELAPLSLIANYRYEAVYGVELIGFASRFEKLINLVLDPKADKDKLEAQKQALIGYSRRFFKDFELAVDREVFAAMMQAYSERVPEQLQPQFLLKVKEQNGNWRQLASQIYSQTAFADSVRVITLLSGIDSITVKEFVNDPVFGIYLDFEDFYRQNIRDRYYEISDSLNVLYRYYVEGLMRMQPDKRFFPDANSTLRIAYGKVGGFAPRDGVVYNYYTTIDGVYEKAQQRNVPDYVAPERLIEFYKKKDFGPYAENGTVPVAFIASNHTTGGNSGSPVLDAEGNLIGVNFDRCWESTMSDVMFDPNYCRNITLDIRYALFIIDKFAGAKNLVDEMEIIN
ncbi:S46 family peptidase [Tenuifilum thalassicum]|uniref:Dipeptidyl-peptidase n=1 Tax=Tenuifilum thalassicum TaxID=2590900 RepID=A0A7D4CS08_9BACT|nr:S46 family peptidase [Tenuifilum thalassicum]QKG80445.1 S46 family peptidase [Tenuifilum thalassicum]